VTEDVGTGGNSPQSPCYGTSVSTAYASGMLALLRSDDRHNSQTRTDFLKDLQNYCHPPAHSATTPADYGMGIIRYVPKATDGELEEIKDNDATMTRDKTKLTFSGQRVGDFSVPIREDDWKKY